MWHWYHNVCGKTLLALPGAVLHLFLLFRSQNVKKTTDTALLRSALPI